MVHDLSAIAQRPVERVSPQRGPTAALYANCEHRTLDFLSGLESDPGCVETLSVL